jgi:glycosidase
MVEKTLKDLDFSKLYNRTFHPSPVAWEDQVLYFLLLDRFSDGNEQGFRGNDGEIVQSGVTPQFCPEDNGNAVRNEQEAAAWREAGTRWVGGNLRGLTGKLGYLKRLG